MKDKKVTAKSALGKPKAVKTAKTAKSKTATKAEKIIKPISRPIKKIRTTPVTSVHNFRLETETKDEPIRSTEKAKKSWFCACGSDSTACECNFTKIFAGLVLVLLGLFYLGRNLGVFPFDVYVNLSVLWPLVIVFLGLSMLNSKTLKATLWGVLVAVLVVPFVLMVLMVRNTNYYDSPEFRMPVVRHIEKAKVTQEVAIDNSVKLNDLEANQLVKSPLKFSGEISGSWFFEGSFPVKVLNEKGEEIGKGLAKAEGEWMTTDAVKFNAEVEFDKTESMRGMVVLTNDNPSGLANLERKIVVPVMFK